MESDMDLTKLKLSLDQVTIDFFETLELLYHSQARLDGLMRSGFLSLSRARYSMGGTRNVGALQFDNNEMEALSVIDLAESLDGEWSDKYGADNSWTNFDLKLLQKHAGSTKSKKTDSKSVDADKSDDIRLRQRKGQNIVSQDQDRELVEMTGIRKGKGDADEVSEAKERNTLKDPLTLFGVLVSPHLRLCQASFKQAVAVTVEIANLKLKLQGLRQRCEDLMTKKNELMASCNCT